MRKTRMTVRRTVTRRRPRQESVLEMGEHVVKSLESFLKQVRKPKGRKRAA